MEETNLGLELLLLLRGGDLLARWMGLPHLRLLLLFGDSRARCYRFDAFGFCAIARGLTGEVGHICLCVCGDDDADCVGVLAGMGKR